MSGRGGRPCCFHHAPAGPQEGRAAAPALHGPTSATSPAGPGQNPAPDPRPPDGRSRGLLRQHTAAGAARKTGRRSALAGAGARAHSRQLQQKPGAGVLGLIRWPTFPAPGSWPVPYLLHRPCFCGRCFEHFERVQSPSSVVTQVGEVPEQEVHQVWARLQQNWAPGPGGSSL